MPNFCLHSWRQYATEYQLLRITGGASAVDLRLCLWVSFRHIAGYCEKRMLKQMSHWPASAGYLSSYCFVFWWSCELPWGSLALKGRIPLDIWMNGWSMEHHPWTSISKFPVCVAHRSCCVVTSVSTLISLYSDFVVRPFSEAVICANQDQFIMFNSFPLCIPSASRRQ